MAFIQDPRLRQRWNHISQTTEAVTENAAAGIWTFQHRYITPCFSSVADSLDACTALCIGDREERARRARERDRGARRSRAPEYTFDFYDDWADDFPEVDDGGEGSGGQGILGRITGEDWDRLLAGTGGGRKGGEEVSEQPRRKRGMSYGTRGAGRRKVAEEEDPTVIPSTAPLGFLGRLPFRIGGKLRYKPSAANLKEHPVVHGREEGAERQPLLGMDEDDEPEDNYGTKGGGQQQRSRSNTTGSGATSDSYRSRNDLFPSDGEGEEDAVPLDDEFAVALDRVDDRGSNRTRSSKGKRVEGRSNSGLSLNLARTVSRTTIGSTLSRETGLKGRRSDTSIRQVDGPAELTMDDLQREEDEVRREEEKELEIKRRRAAQLALERGLGRDDLTAVASEAKNDEIAQAKPLVAEPDDVLEDRPVQQSRQDDVAHEEKPQADPGPYPASGTTLQQAAKEPPDFVPARLPYFR